MRRILFAGPSLSSVPGTELGEIELRPPAGKGDLLAAVLDGATVIGLVDGTFEFSPSTWHKEILFALDRGVAVFGAASLGALRAAECAAFGMQGIGQIYNDYLSGRRTADADVAVVHGPAGLGHQPLTEALVDIEATLANLTSAGLLPAERCTRLLAAARAAHFKDRSWQFLIDRADIPEADRTLALVKTHRVSIKTADALLLIDAMRRSDIAAERQSLPAPFSHTMFFDALLDDVRRRSQ